MRAALQAPPTSGPRSFPRVPPQDSRWLLYSFKSKAPLTVRRNSDLKQMPGISDHRNNEMRQHPPYGCWHTAGLPSGRRPRGSAAHPQTPRERRCTGPFDPPAALSAWATAPHLDPRLRFNSDSTNGNSSRKSVLCPNEESKPLWTHHSLSQTYFPKLVVCHTFRHHLASHPV